MNAVIVDTGGANLASLKFALQRLGCDAPVTKQADRIHAASHVFLPGVGAAGDTMKRLRNDGLDKVIPSLQQPVLGICLGMQILAEGSRENDTNCLGLIPGMAERIEPAPGRSVPHMGWNRLQHNGAGLFTDVAEGAYVYFVHSYALGPGAQVSATFVYGQPLAAAVEHGNFYGTQFHPERSGAVGARILENFLGAAGMQLIPAIDIQHGACVRLLRGDFDSTVIYADDPVAPAREFAGLGAAVLHIVDLDGAAAGRPVNTALIGQIAAETNCLIQTGGGLRDEAGIETALEAAGRVVLGSMAVTERERTHALLGRLGAARIVLAFDVRRRDGVWRPWTHGWTAPTDLSLHDVLADYVAAGLRHVLITDIDRDGALTGPNVKLYDEIVRAFPTIALQASGGIRDAADLTALERCGVAAAISGKALLDQRISATEMQPYLRSA